ncbi:glutathione S-transferase [Rhizobium brockwellii]
MKIFDRPGFPGQRDKALGGMRYFDMVLQDRSFVAGDAFSMADSVCRADVRGRRRHCHP